MTPHDIYVLRHGETEWNAAGRMQGRLNSPLTEAGRAQAARLGALLQGIDIAAHDVWVSPQGRAIETATIALGPRAQDMRTDDRLREISVGDWDGAVMDDIWRAHPQHFAPEAGFAWIDQAPGGEGFAALRTRCAAFLTDLRRPAIIVTHGITSRMLRSLAMCGTADLLEDLPGGQGVIHAVRDKTHQSLAG